METSSSIEQPSNRLLKRKDSDLRILEEYLKQDRTLNWFYQPHTIFILLIGVICAVLIAFSRNETTDSSSNLKSGMIAAALAFLLFSMLQMRDSLFRRPHRAFWRIILGVAVIYLILLVFLLFQTVDDARQMVAFWDPNLGKPLPERSYAADCRLFTPENPHSYFYNLKSTIYDEYILAHFVGWFAKALIFRDSIFCWILSILFEFIEPTFQHMLDNLKECWWDHIILDILVCNGLGIYFGMKFCRWLQMHEYDWTGMSRRKNMLIKALSTITPEKYETYNLKLFSSPKRFIYLIILILCIEAMEINLFFLKYLLWIPPTHPIVIIRLVMIILISAPAMREYYQFMIDRNCNRFGTSVWLAFAIILLESLISFKWGTGHFPEPWPKHVVFGWATFITFFIIVSTTFFYFKSISEYENEIEKEYQSKQTEQEQNQKEQQKTH